MSTWNDIPFDESADAATKALEFDLQLAENQRQQEIAAAQQQHNCTNPPHFPPHCGCPA